MLKFTGKILLIEDNKADYRLVQFLLEDADHFQGTLHWEASFGEGIEYFKTHPVDVVLLDLNLPDFQGLEMINHLLEINDAVPIIVLTGIEDEVLAGKAINMGAQDYLVKGHFAGDVLSRSMNYAIERNHLNVELKRQKENLLKAENRFRTLVTNNVDGILVLRKDGEILFTNPAAEEFFGESRENLIGRKVPFDEKKQGHFEIEIETASSGKHVVEIRIAETEWENEKVLLTSISDLTERKEAEAKLLDTQAELKAALEKLKRNQRKLLHVEKLKSVQELAAGVSHEFSQPLQALSNYVGIMEEVDPRNQYIQKCRTMVNRISELNVNLRHITKLEKKDYLSTQIMDLEASSSKVQLSLKDRILVVDDEKEVRETLVEMFQLKGFECDGAEDGLAALELLDQNKHRYELIVSDVMMPNMSGPEFFKAVKKRKIDSKFIFLTGYEIPGTEVETIETADAVLTKPISMDHFLHTLQQLSGIETETSQDVSKTE